MTATAIFYHPTKVFPQLRIALHGYAQLQSSSANVFIRLTRFTQNTMASLKKPFVFDVARSSTEAVGYLWLGLPRICFQSHRNGRQRVLEHEREQAPPWGRDAELGSFVIALVVVFAAEKPDFVAVILDDPNPSNLTPISWSEKDS